MNLQEALENSGVAASVRQQAENERQAAEVARKERNASLSPHQRWWQNFRLTVTPFEIPIFIKVECEKWTEGLDFIRGKNLNKVKTRCRTREEAIEEVRDKILKWQAEAVLIEGEQPKAGTLLYWRIYG